MKKLLSLFGLLALVGTAHAEPVKTQFNVFTGKPDFITKIDTNTIQGGGGITVTGFSSGTVLITASGSSPSNLETIFGVERTSPTATLRGTTSDFTGSVTGSTMTISLSTNVVRSDRANTFVSSQTFTQGIGATTANFSSSMTLSGGVTVQNIAPTSGQVLKYDGTNWAPGTDNNSGGGGAGYDVEPATITFNLAQGVTASTGSFGSTSSSSPALEIKGLGITSGSSEFVQYYGALGAGSYIDSAYYLGTVGYSRLGALRFTNTTAVGTGDAAGFQFLDSGNNPRVVYRNFDPFGLNINSTGTLRLYQGDDTKYVEFGSSQTITHTQRYVLPISTGTVGVGSPLKISSINGDGTVGLGWGTDDTTSNGIVSPGTFTWTNTYGISASTIAASQWITASSVTFTTATIAGCTIDSTGIGCTGGSNAGAIGLYENQSNGSDYIQLVAPQSLDYIQTWELPTSTGTAGQVLQVASVGTSSITLAFGTVSGSGDNLGNGTGSFGVNTSTGGFSSWVSVSSNAYLAAGNTFYYNASPQFANAPIVNALTASSWVKTDANKMLVTADNNGSVGISYDGAGSALTAGGTSYITAPYTGTITGWTLIATSTGSLVVDVKKCAGFNCDPTTSIAGSEIPTLSSVWANQDLSLGTWTTDITEGDKIAFVMNSAATITKATLTIHVRKQ